MFSNTVWGEADCFVQYHFPTVGDTEDPEVTQGNSDDCSCRIGIQRMEVVGCSSAVLFPPSSSSSSASDPIDSNRVQEVCLHPYRTGTTLCVPSPAFSHATRHTLSLQSDRPLHRELMAACRAAGGVTFELWRRFYYPNIRDQLVARVQNSTVI